MVLAGTPGVGMNQNRQAPSVQHEPGHESREFGHREGHLVHGPGVGALGPVQAGDPQDNGETLRDFIPQDLGDLRLLGSAEIDVGVIGADGVDRLRRRRFAGSGNAGRVVFGHDGVIPVCRGVLEEGLRVWC